MGALTMTYGDASFWAALLGLGLAMRQRFGTSPINGTSVAVAHQPVARQHAVTTHLVAVKADRFRPRGRRL